MTGDYGAVFKMRLSDEEMEAARKLAVDLGIVKKRSGDPNLAELFRSLLLAGVEAQEEGKLLVRSKRLPPAPITFKGDVLIARAASPDADDLEYGELDE